MEQRLKPIDTEYANHLFRSRLEARWAVYFDTLRIKWVYEPEGYEMNRYKYLPDFYFPELDFYAEIKPDNFGDSDVKKWCAFVKATKKPLVIFEGTPHAKDCRIFYYDGKVFTDYHRVIPFAHLSKISYGTFWYCGNMEDWSNYLPYKRAIKAAIQERFDSF